MVDVSIIIPTYNRLWCLPRAISSCLNTKCNVEIIVVDDGSTDGTWDWLLTQTKITALYQQNKGQTYAINQGVSIASGKYIRFLDSDDFLTESTIDDQFKVAEDNCADLVYSKVDIYNNDNGQIFKSPQIERWNDFLEIQLSNRPGSHFLGMLFKTNHVKNIPRRADFALREDRMFLLEYGLLEPKTVFLDICAGYWVKHNDQMQANYQGWEAQVTNWQHLNIYKNIVQHLQSNNKLTQGRRNAVSESLWPLAHWIAKAHLKEAIEIVKWIYELNPDFQIPETGLLGWCYRKLGFTTTEKILVIRRLLFGNSFIRY